jgi:hypothetical protein
MQNQKVKKTRPGSTGSRHWNYQGGQETLAAKQKRSETSLRLRYLQDMGHDLGFMGGRRMPGRKPVNYLVLDYKNLDHLVYVIHKINEVYNVS